MITVEPGCYFIDALLVPAMESSNTTEFFNREAIARIKGFGGVRIKSDLVIFLMLLYITLMIVPIYYVIILNFKAKEKSFFFSGLPFLCWCILFGHTLYILYFSTIYIQCQYTQCVYLSPTIFDDPRKRRKMKKM